MTKEHKLQFIDIISSIFSSKTQNIYLIDNSKMNAFQTNQLRRNCYTSQVKVLMVKTTLVKKVMEKYKKKWYTFFKVFKGNTFIMISFIENAPAKIIKDYCNNNKLPLLKGAYVAEVFYLGHDKLEFLVNLKSKEELIMGIILSLQSSFTKIVTVLHNPVFKIIDYLQKNINFNL